MQKKTERMANEKITAPELKKVEKLTLPEPAKYTLDNNIPVYILEAGHQEVLKIELIFPAGKWYESKKGSALFTSKLLKEGTFSFSAGTIAEKIDFLGAGLKINLGADIITVEVYCLNKFLEQMLHILADVLMNANFAESELDLQRTISIQKLKVNEERIEYKAQKKINEIIFGHDHPYGYALSEKDIKQLEREDLIKFYSTHISSDDCKIFVSGKPKADTISLLNNYLGHYFNRESKINYDLKHEKTPARKKKAYIHKDGATQAAIRIGKPVINKYDDEYSGLRILNMIFGGYFGSRLMSNIREDKGYTYGIHSVLQSFQKEGLFFISSEVGSEVCQNAIKEIYFEVDRLKQEPVPEEELELVKNYLLGRILTSIDGPFSTITVIKDLVMYNKTSEDFYKWLDLVNSITSGQIQDLAIKYFDESTFYEAVAGCR